jgi:hypothetical protein
MTSTFQSIWRLMRDVGRLACLGSLRERRARASLAAAFMSAVFACFSPASAADPTDARLVADVALAKTTITLLQSRDFNAVRERLDPAIGPFSDDVLGRMADVIAGEIKSIETVSSEGNFNVGNGDRESQTILEYQIGSRWIVADAVIKTENNIERISGLYFSVNNQSLRDSSIFSGKGFVQYAFLAGWIGIIGLTGYAMVLAFRRHSGWRRWVLMITMPVGVGPAVAMNWTNAAFWTFGGFITKGGTTFYPIFTGRFPMAWFGMFGGTEFHLPYFYISVPLIAIGYLIWRASVQQRPTEQSIRG